MPTPAASHSCLSGAMGQILRKSNSRRKTASMKRKRDAPNATAKKSTLEKHGVSGKKRNGGTGGAQNNRKKRNASPDKKQRDRAAQDNAPRPDLKKSNTTRVAAPESQRKQAKNVVEGATKPPANKHSKKKLSSLAQQPSAKPDIYSTPIPPLSAVPKKIRIATPNHQPTPKQRPTRAKVVVIDGTSAAAAYGGDMSEAVERAVAYYEERSVQALAVVPYGVEAAGAVAAPPGATTRHVALREAARRGGDLLCNGDLEADLAQQQGRARRRKMRRFLQRHWIPFTFIRGELLPNPHPRRLLESVHAPRKVDKRNKGLRFMGRMRRGRVA